MISQKSKVEENVATTVEGNTKDIKERASPSNNEAWLQKGEKESSSTFLRFVRWFHCLCWTETALHPQSPSVFLRGWDN